MIEDGILGDFRFDANGDRRLGQGADHAHHGIDPAVGRPPWLQGAVVDRIGR